MALSLEIREQIANHAFMQINGVDFMRLWEVREVHKIYEIVLISVAIKEKVHWKQIYDFDKDGKYFGCLCVALLVIHDALKYWFPSQNDCKSVLQEREYAVVKSYHLL
jgi:hypothetical protein